MKKILYILPLLVATLISCEKEEGLADATNAVTINATIGEGIPLTRVNSAESDATTWNTGDKIAVSNGGEFVNYTFASGNTWTTETGKFLKWSSPTMTFNAYYPAKQGIDMENFSLPADQDSVYKIAVADYMTYSGSKSKPASGFDVDLALTRKTARVIVNVSFNNEFGTTPKPFVGVVFVTSAHSKYTSGKPAGNYVTVATFRNSIVSENQFIALVIPSEQKIDERFIGLEIYYDEGYGKSKVVSLKGVPPMEVGKSYTYNLRAGKDKLEVVSATVKDWGTPEEISGGEAIDVPD